MEKEQKAELLKALPHILKKENIAVIAGSDEMLEVCVQVGNAAALIPMMQNALLIAIDSLPNPALRLSVRQRVATRIMTKDMTDFVTMAQELGMGKVIIEEVEDDAAE